MGSVQIGVLEGATIEALDVDAFLFDAFSNPGAATMEKRLFPFIEKLQAAHPGDHGYTLWAESIQKPLKRILRKYGIQ